MIPANPLSSLMSFDLVLEIRTTYSKLEWIIHGPVPSKVCLGILLKDEVDDEMVQLINLFS